MTSTLISNLPCAQFTRRLAAVLVAVGATACTVDKNLATVSDGDTEVSAATTAEPTSSTTGDDTTAGGASSSTTDNATTAPTSTTDNSTTDDSTTDGTTGEPVVTCPENPKVDDCCCFEQHDIYVENVCTAEQEVLCGDVILTCMDGGNETDGPCNIANDEALVDCALSALKGDKAGSIRVIFGSEENPGWWSRHIDYHIVGDGTAYRVDDTFVDLGGDYKDTGLYDLQPSVLFDVCLAGSLADKANCLRDAVTGEAKDLCIPAFYYTDSI